jgi:hypothetical protein
MPCCRSLVAVSALVVTGLALAPSAHGQVVTDPNYWKQTEARQDTVYRLFYSQSPRPARTTSTSSICQIPCTRRAVARFDVIGQEEAKRGIITSFAYPGWWRKSDFPNAPG